MFKPKILPMSANILDYKQLREILPQDYPFLLIDKVIDYEKGKSLTAIKNITGNEWAIGENNSELSIFPETLLIEAAAQAALVIYHVSKIQNVGKKPKYILGKVKCEFERQAYIGDQLRIEVIPTKMLNIGGYTDIRLYINHLLIGKIEIIYSVERS